MFLFLFFLGGNGKKRYRRNFGVMVHPGSDIPKVSSFAIYIFTRREDVEFAFCIYPEVILSTILRF